MESPAPIVQLVLTIQVAPAAHSLTMPEWVELARSFADDYPVYTEIGRAGPMPAQFTQLVIESPTGLPRMSLSSPDLVTHVSIQDDRITAMWQRAKPLSEDPEYPGFAHELTRLLDVAGRAFEFIRERSSTAIATVVGEVVYVDAFLLKAPAIAQRTMEDIFTTIRSNPGFQWNQINLTYRQRLPGPHKTMIQGSAETIISGPAENENGEAFVQLQSTIRFETNGAEGMHLIEPFNAAHDVASSIFNTLVKPDASSISAAQ